MDEQQRLDELSREKLSDVVVATGKEAHRLELRIPNVTPERRKTLMDKLNKHLKARADAVSRVYHMATEDTQLDETQLDKDGYPIIQTGLDDIPVRPSRKSSKMKKEDINQEVEPQVRAIRSVIESIKQSQINETFEEAEAHKAAADKAKAKGNMGAFHAHMAAHHDSMAEWNASKGRHSVADKHAEKAEEHHEASLKHPYVKEEFELVESSKFSSKKEWQSKVKERHSDAEFSNEDGAHVARKGGVIVGAFKYDKGMNSVSGIGHIKEEDETPKHEGWKEVTPGQKVRKEEFVAEGKPNQLPTQKSFKVIYRNPKTGLEHTRNIISNDEEAVVSHFKSKGLEIVSIKYMGLADKIDDDRRLQYRDEDEDEDDQGVAEGVVMPPASFIGTQPPTEKSAKQEKADERDVRLLKKYREKNLGLGSALERLKKYKQKHNGQNVAEGSTKVDMVGKKCNACKKGTYQETKVDDDMRGTLHCTKCNKEVNRWQAPKQQGMAEGKLKEDNEQLDEISKQVLGSYVKKASKNLANTAVVSRDFANSKSEFHQQLSDKLARKAMNRAQNIDKAVDRLAKEEYMDDLSARFTESVQRYISGQIDDIALNSIAIQLAEAVADTKDISFEESYEIALAYVGEMIEESEAKFQSRMQSYVEAVNSNAKYDSEKFEEAYDRDWGSMSKRQFKRAELEHELAHEVAPRKPSYGARRPSGSSTSQTKIYHKVPYAQKDDAKKEGMRFDGAAKKWYHTDQSKSSSSKFQKEEFELDEAKGELTYTPKHQTWAVIPKNRKHFVKWFPPHREEEARAHANATGGKLKKVDQMGRVMKEEVDQEHPIVKEYNGLKNHDLKTLKGMIKGQRRIVDTSEIRSKEHAISTYLRHKHGNKKVAAAFGLSEETLDELSTDTLKNYYGKAMSQERARETGKRTKGIAAALAKIRAKKQKNEEVELDEKMTIVHDPNDPRLHQPRAPGRGYVYKPKPTTPDSSRPNKPASSSILDRTRASMDKRSQSSVRNEEVELDEAIPYALSSANFNASHHQDNYKGTVNVPLKHVGGTPDYKAIKKHVASKGLTVASIGTGDGYKTVTLASNDHTADEMKAKLGLKEEVELDEAVEVSHDRYVRSHGKKASGTGNYMFTHKREGGVDYNNEREVHQARGSFSDAAKSAKEWAKKHGHQKVYVMESVTSPMDLYLEALQSNRSILK